MSSNGPELSERSREIRRKVLDLAKNIPGAHLGGSFSEVEIMISLYDHVMTADDRFILSKGHACFPYYVLLREKGYKPNISSHPDRDDANGIYCTTGSLGHGLPMGVGMATARKLKGEKGDIYVLMSDGECQEGTTWESALLANKFGLDNLIVVVDYNRIQATDFVDNVLPLGDLKEKFRAFGFSSCDTDGHCVRSLIRDLTTRLENKPRAVIAHTVKGKGISFMENDSTWHARKINPEQIAQAYAELGDKR